jgi:RNA polymerase sigma factor (TIGR02999 family)
MPPAPRSDPTREGALLERVYTELRELAAQHLRRERRAHTLQPTALAHEAWIKLEQGGARGTTRAELMALAAVAIRRILVDHARRRAADKRGRGERVMLEDRTAPGTPAAVDLLALDEALQRLHELDARQARIVELRFFAGLEVDEVARALGISPRTVAGDWAMAKAFLHAQLAGGRG